MKTELINTGYFYADGGAMFGAIPKTAWQRRYEANNKNRCVLAMRSMLVITDCGRIILIDTGVGNKHLKKLSYYSFFDLSDLLDQLAGKGISCKKVTDVVLTHLHFDHCGYATQYDVDGSSTLSFPNATHWVSQAQLENCMQSNALEKDSYFPENIIPVQEAGKLALINEDTNLCPFVSLHLYNGHTPGQIVPYIHMPEQTIVFAGDVIPLAASVSPRWISAYDTCPLISYQEKIRMLEEAASKNQQIVFCHDTCISSGEIKKINDDFFQVKNM